jgi:putative heme-binding domain-containing protein
MRFLPPLLAAAFLLASCSRTPSPYRAPDGFRVVQTAYTGSLVALTFDSFGRPAVAPERLHPLLLSDRDRDGIFESQHVFTTQIRNLQGMWFDGRTLYAVAQNAQGEQTGLYECPDANSDDIADTCRLLNPFERTIAEHGPHAIRRSIDGEPLVILGNHTAVPKDFIDPNSPLANTHESQLLTRYNDPRGHAANIPAPGGILTRLNRKTGKYTLLAGGMRNAYDFAIHPSGDVFTFDSDMEWDINLPWYRGVRSLFLAPGGDYGWRTGSGKLPEYTPDTLPSLRDLGRGSPVGVEFYTSHHYPAPFRNAYFEADWSRGRILVSHPKPCGGTYCLDPKPREFLHGEPLNVTDIETGPDGNLWFTTGGRDTAGGLYKIEYSPGLLQKAYYSRPEPEGVYAITRQPQPLSSWGHAALLARKQSLGAAWQKQLSELALSNAAPPADRAAALLTLERLGPRPNADLIRPLAASGHPDLRAAAVLVASFHSSPRAKAIVASGLSDENPHVRRRSLEGLLRMGLTSENHESFAPAGIVQALLADRDRHVRYAARLVLERYPRQLWAAAAATESSIDAVPESLYALARTASSDADIDPLFHTAITFAKLQNLHPETRLAALRALQLLAIRKSQPTPDSVKQETHSALLPLFPSGDERIDRELARTLAWAGRPEAIPAILGAMPPSDLNQPLQIHYAYCLREIKSGWSPEQKRTLLNWFQKASQWRGGASFPGYINLIFDSALEFFTPEERQTAYAKIPLFAPLSEPPTPRADGHVRAAAAVRSTGVQAISNEEILEFQLFSPMTLKSNPARGREIFEKACASCHRRGPLGQDFGPDLTYLARRFNKKDILESILYPSKTISDQYASLIVETRDNDIHNALLVKEDAQKLTLKTADLERPFEIQKLQVKSRRPSKISIMPEGLLNDYSQGQIADLLAFLLQTTG